MSCLLESLRVKSFYSPFNLKTVQSVTRAIACTSVSGSNLSEWTWTLLITTGKWNEWNKIKLEKSEFSSGYNWKKTPITFMCRILTPVGGSVAGSDMTCGSPCTVARHRSVIWYHQRACWLPIQNKQYVQ